jgi:ABC-type glycerol-3-phosphate transport system substrate-binding protein
MGDRAQPPSRAAADAGWWGIALIGVAWILGCEESASGRVVVTFPSSSVGAEAEVLSRQLDRFMQRNPGIIVERRRTPDAANQRHQLYVQWLNAHAADPDILQLDSIWTAQFAAADWLLPLDAFGVEVGDFLPAGIAANRYRGGLFALPWFVDVGMLYYRSDLVPRAPASYAELEQWAARATELGVRHGLVLQAARYEGLMTVFVEYLTAFGGALFDARGDVAVNSDAGRRALGALQRAFERGIVPRDALTWQEEQTRFAFQNGHALFMRNWPYAYGLMQKPDSRVAGRFGVAPFPAAEGGRAAAAFGGSQLAINKYSDQPAAAHRVIQFLLQSEQMIERARIASQWPPRPSLYRNGALAGALPIEPAAIEAILASAVPRPSTPVYSQLSEIVQIHLHRCLSQQETAAAALDAAALEMRALLGRLGLPAPSDRR